MLPWSVPTMQGRKTTQKRFTIWDPPEDREGSQDCAKLTVQGWVYKGSPCTRGWQSLSTSPDHKQPSQHWGGREQSSGQAHPSVDPLDCTPIPPGYLNCSSGAMIPIKCNGSQRHGVGAGGSKQTKTNKKTPTTFQHEELKRDPLNHQISASLSQFS